MRLCKYCNKELFDKRKKNIFCNIKCANSFNNKNKNTFFLTDEYKDILRERIAKGRIEAIKKIKGKTYIEIYGQEKANILICQLQKRQVFKNQGKASTIEKELARREKIRKSINERYANGWEVKCGRASKIDYESKIAGKIKVDGTWELKVAQYFDSISVKWQRNKKRFKYFNKISNKFSTYCPDFYVDDWNLYIEVKGYKTELDNCKWEQFKYPLIIYDKEKLKELMIL